MAKSVLTKFKEEKKSLAVAESCTGGLLMSTLTEIPGASEVFLGGVVAYANAVKESVLHVSSTTLALNGAVSSECVLGMCDGLFQITNADVAIAVSGIFGPLGGTQEKPVGTVWMAIGERGKSLKSALIPLELNLKRTQYRDIVVTYLLEALWKL